MMSSPTPSNESLSGATALGSLVEPEQVELALGLHGCPQSSSSSSTCSSTVRQNLTGFLGPGTVGGVSSSHSSGSGESHRPLSPLGVAAIKCKICDETFQRPKVLPCLHTFCEDCLEKAFEHNNPEQLTCPTCRMECPLSAQGVAGLLPDYAVTNLIEVTHINEDENASKCTGCKSENSPAVARCYDCSNHLCSNCVMAHQFMHCFEGHRLIYTNNETFKESGIKTHVPCTQHTDETLAFYCRTCAIPTCIECIDTEHPKSDHELEVLSDCESSYVKNLAQYVHEFRLRSMDLHEVLKSFEAANFRLQNQYSKAQTEISEAFAFYQNVLNDRKTELTRELESIYISRQVALSVVTQQVQETLERMYQTIEFSDRLLRHASPPQILLFKTLLEKRFQALLNIVPNPNLAKTAANGGDLEFVSNYPAMQTAFRNTLGYIRSSCVSDVTSSFKQTAITRPISKPNSNQASQDAGLNAFNNMLRHNSLTGPGLLEMSQQSKCMDNGNGPIGHGFNSGGILSYEKWSNAGDMNSLNGQNDFFLDNGSDIFSTKSLSSNDPVLELSSKLIAPLNLKGSTIKRQKMIYHCKFGEFGTGEAQFTEPSGVAVTGNNEIVVADTNNHRIQIFDQEGRFKFQFGECGKRDGQLLYPNRVAVVKPTGDIVVTERSPTHQIQIYNQYGQFVRKFGANVLQHPRGVTVDDKGRIIVVECKVMRVVIFDQTGAVINKFGCSKHLEFPNGVVVNDREEIFISDNRAHSVKVFNYEGVFLRQIGGEGITNYPIGVGINAKGEILVADNHNNFNLTIFTQDGQIVSALESKVKHAQCFDVALMDDGSVVLASKDYRLYIYRYAQVTIAGL